MVLFVPGRGKKPRFNRFFFVRLKFERERSKNGLGMPIAFERSPNNVEIFNLVWRRQFNVRQTIRKAFSKTGG